MIKLHQSTLRQLNYKHFRLCYCEQTKLSPRHDGGPRLSINCRDYSDTFNSTKIIFSKVVRNVADSRSYYDVLGLPLSATASDVRTAFISLAKICHPDVAPSGETLAGARAFLKVQHAYSVLSSTAKRKAYDREALKDFVPYSNEQTYATRRNPVIIDESDAIVHPSMRQGYISRQRNGALLREMKEKMGNSPYNYNSCPLPLNFVESVNKEDHDTDQHEAQSYTRKSREGTVLGYQTETMKKKSVGLTTRSPEANHKIVQPRKKLLGDIYLDLEGKKGTKDNDNILADAEGYSNDGCALSGDNQAEDTSNIDDEPINCTNTPTEIINDASSSLDVHYDGTFSVHSGCYGKGETEAAKSRLSTVLQHLSYRDKSTLKRYESLDRLIESLNKQRYSNEPSYKTEWRRDREFNPDYDQGTHYMGTYCLRQRAKHDWDTRYKWKKKGTRFILAKVMVRQ
eukprot:Filipodium_phascolosomae@DN1871_c0_g1_i1.p1